MNNDGRYQPLHRHFMLLSDIHLSIRSVHVFLVVSLLFHALLLCLPLKQPIARKTPPLQDRLFAVELHIPEAAAGTTNAPTKPAPPALPHDNQSTKTETHAQPRPEQQSVPEKKVQEREATVSLDRLSDGDAQYRSYLGHLRSKISAAWHYPQEASDRGLNGTATVRFSIARNGGLESVTVKRSSGHRMLDDEALRTIRAAAPFLPFPSEFTIETLHVSASFEYEFSGR